MIQKNHLIIISVGIIVLVSILLISLGRDNEKYSICDRFPDLPVCKANDIPRTVVPRIRRVVPNFSPKVTRKSALTVAGGGMVASSVFHGIMTAALQLKRVQNRDPYLRLSDLKFDYRSGASGGGVGTTLMVYDKEYNEQVNQLNLTAYSMKEQYIKGYVNKFIKLRNRYTDLDQDSLSILRLPFFATALIGIATTLFDGIEGVIGLGGTTKLASIYLLDRHNNTKMSDVLEEYSNTQVIIPSSLLTSGSLNFPNIPSLNLSYNLPTGDTCLRTLPYNHGPLSSSTRFGDTVIKAYNASSLNALRYWDVTPRPPEPGPLPDNTMFDTCEWVQKYEYGVFSNTIQPYKVYRCKNIASGECCQNTSTTSPCTSYSIVNYSSKPDGVSFTIPSIYSETTQYYSYNVDTEKQPTGEWQDEVTDLISSDAQKLVAELPTSINTMNYDTSQESLKMVNSATTSLPGAIADPCFIKSVVYSCGFSDQEEFVNRIQSIGVNLSPYIRTNSSGSNNNRLYKNMCSLLGNNTTCSNLLSSRFSELNPDYDISIPLKEIITKKPLCLSDGGTTDNSGMISSILAHQKDNMYAELDITNITTSPRAAHVLFEENPYVDEYGNSTIQNDIRDALQELADLVNQISNFGLLEELALGAASIAGLTLFGGLASLLGSLFGIAVTAGLIATFSELAWEIIDLDTDYHTVFDKNGGEFTPEFNIRAPIAISGSGRTTEAGEFTEYTNVNRGVDGLPFKLSITHFKRKTVDNSLFGIRAGTKINLTVISFTSYEPHNVPLIPFFAEDGEQWGELARLAFGACINMVSTYSSISGYRKTVIKRALGII